MINLKAVTLRHKNFHEIKKLYHDAFPRSERIPLWLLMIRAKSKAIHFLSIHENGQFCGIVYFVECRNIIQISYLAIHTQNRSNGCGSRVLNYIRNKYKGHSIVLEIESLCGESDNSDQRKRRKDFYMRNGFINSGYSFSMFGVQYEILKSKEDLTKDELSEVYKKLFWGLVKFDFET